MKWKIQFPALRAEIEAVLLRIPSRTLLFAASKQQRMPGIGDEQSSLTGPRRNRILHVLPFAHFVYLISFLS